MARKAMRTSEQWKNDIKNAAAQLFEDKGYQETSIVDIMELVGGAKGMFYQSFRSKEEILNVLVEEWAEQYIQKVTSLCCEQESTFREKFLSILRVISEMSSKTVGTESFFKCSSNQMLNKLTQNMTSKFVPILTDVLDNGVKEGILLIENTEFYANYIIHGSLGALNYGSGSPKENIEKNLCYLPKVIAHILNLDSEIFRDENIEGLEKNK